MGMLYEEGKFLFSDPVSEYLPEWRHTVRWQRRENGTIELVPLEHPITVRDAAAMMCGLPYCMFPDPNAADPTVKGMSEKMEQLLKNGTPTLREEVRQMAEVPVYFEPGTHWLYGFGSEIIGAIVEEITGKPLRVSFSERLIEPLGLKDTGTCLTPKIRKHLVTMYRKEPWNTACAGKGSGCFAGAGRSTGRRKSTAADQRRGFFHIYEHARKRGKV